MTAGTRRYVFAPLERKGVIAGLGAAQVGLFGGALLVDTVLLRAAPSGLGVLAAMAILAGAAGIAFVPIGGRPVGEWMPTVGRRSGRLATGSTTTRAAPGPAGLTGGALPVPAAFRGLMFDEISRPGADPLGVIRDRVTATLTAVVAVRGRSFALLDGADKERRLAAWSSILAGLSREGSPVRSLQWVERMVPGDAHQLTRHFDAGRTLPAESAPALSYASLVAEAGPLGQEHECFVAMTIRMRKGRAQATPETVLLRELRLLEGQLRSAELDVDRVLSRRAIGAVLRSAFDPWASTGLARRAALHPDLLGCSPEAAWPTAADEGWACWRADDAWHATFWVAEWPRAEVGPDFLAPLLLHTAGQRSVSVIMAPLPPSAGIREAEAARTSQAADEQLRRRAGFLATARRQREAAGIALRESELSDGHAAYRFSGYVTVTAANPEALEVACGEVVQAGHQCRLELRRLLGIQDLAFAWTLPVGRGLAAR